MLLAMLVSVTEPSRFLTRTIRIAPNGNLTRSFMIQLTSRRTLSPMRSNPPAHPVRLATRLRTAILGVTLACTTSALADGAPGSITHADAERARDNVRRGEFVPLERIVADALERHPGRVVEAELDGDEYEVEILSADGVRVELEYEARTGRLVEVEYDD